MKLQDIISGFKKLSNIVKNNVKITKNNNINFFYMCKKLDNFITYFCYLNNYK